MSVSYPRKLQRPVNDARSWQEKWKCRLLVEEVYVRDVQTLEFCAFLKLCCELSLNLLLFIC